MKISKRETILIVVIIFAITGAAYYIYYWVPTMDEIEQINMSIEQKQIKIVSMNNAIDQIDTLKEEIKALEELINQQTEDIPEGVSHAHQLVSITNIMNGRGNDISIFFNQSTEAYENYQKNVANVNFSTSYEKLLDILARFKELDMTNQIVKLDVSYSGDATTSYVELLEGYYLSVALNVEYYSFYKPLDAEPPAKENWEYSPIEYKNPFRPEPDS